MQCKQAVLEAATICHRALQVDLWPFNLESGVRVTCDVAYLCANFSLHGPLCSQLSSDVRDRCQTSSDVRRASSLNASALSARKINKCVVEKLLYNHSKVEREKTVKTGSKLYHGLYSHMSKTRSSADADKLARRGYRSVKITKHGTIPYVRYSFLLVWNSNVAFKTRRFPIFDFKNIVTLKSGSEVTQGHWTWYHSIDWIWFPISVL